MAAQPASAFVTQTLQAVSAELQEGRCSLELFTPWYCFDLQWDGVEYDLCVTLVRFDLAASRVFPVQHEWLPDEGGLGVFRLVGVESNRHVLYAVAQAMLTKIVRSLPMDPEEEPSCNAAC